MHVLLCLATLRAAGFIADNVNDPYRRIGRSIRCVAIPPYGEDESTARSGLVYGRLMCVVGVRAVMNDFIRAFRLFYREVNGELFNVLVRPYDSYGEGSDGGSAYSDCQQVRVGEVKFSV